MGYNVPYPIELEHVLVQHPDIESAAVVGIPDPEFGQRLKAVVIRKRDTTLDQSTLLEWLKPRVARYQMPAMIEFREELPYTPLGKRPFDCAVGSEVDGIGLCERGIRRTPIDFGRIAAIGGPLC